MEKVAENILLMAANALVVKPSLESARAFLNEPNHQVEFPEHEELCTECPNILNPSCMRCRIEVVMAAYAVSLQEPK